ncbi:PREDICTED: transformer-2 protein homolog alpha isoform X2 [Nicotiana attenuata]|uniref:transformer-2 protein homolog alpha isoform X2 n=1 Tax=Nicotiana attenuata TaxID=49451 RepID=UPI0009051B3A|nr:PREDICTED: transformer-2 protein homolog alpha isoform X2 [Nicotiana attenuata]
MVAVFNVYAPLPLSSSIRKVSKYLFPCRPIIHTQHFSSSSSSSSSLSIQPLTRYFQIVSRYPQSSSSRTRFNFNPSTKLFVSGLSFRTTQESLKNAFNDFGELLEVNLVMDKIANRPRGFAFLRYATEEESQKAIQGMHGKFLDGRVIFVEVAKPRSELRRITELPLAVWLHGEMNRYTKSWYQDHHSTSTTLAESYQINPE